MAGRTRQPSATSNFGVSGREGHDSTAFYARFETPEFSEDTAINAPNHLNEILVGDSRSMTDIPDASVALVVTSPPYFAGKAYEEDMTRGEVPSSYLEYLGMLKATFAECVRVLEPGGRIAVNVANLGRKPYRSLSADVISILQDDLRLLLRGEIIWIKARAAGGNCAWGSFQRPSNPVLRDLSERVIIASKGRLDRALNPSARAKAGLPDTSTLSRDEFLDFTTDLWEFPPESATRVGHPAPFPVELPERLIQLYTYRGDVVLDPFMGSGSTAIAAQRLGRSYLGYELDERYAQAARERIKLALQSGERKLPSLSPTARVASLQAGADTPADTAAPDTTVEALMASGVKATDLALHQVTAAGFSDISTRTKLSCGVEIDITATDHAGLQWYFRVCGGYSSASPGLRKADSVWKLLGEASALAASEGSGASKRFVVLATEGPSPQGKAAAALKAVLGSAQPTLHSVLLLGTAETQAVLSSLARPIDSRSAPGTTSAKTSAAKKRSATKAAPKPHPKKRSASTPA